MPSGLKENIRDVGRFGCSRFEVKFRQSVAQIDFFSELREAHCYNALVDFDRGELFDDGSQQGVKYGRAVAQIIIFSCDQRNSSL